MTECSGSRAVWITGKRGVLPRFKNPVSLDRVRILGVSYRDYDRPPAVFRDSSGALYKTEGHNLFDDIVEVGGETEVDLMA